VRDIREQIQARSRRGGAEAPGGSSAVGGAGGEERGLLTLDLGDLLLYGLIENRGVVLLAAGAAALWELGVAERWLGRVFGDENTIRESVGEGIRSLADGGWRAPLATAGALFLGLLVAIRLLSMAWAAVRLYGFRLERRDDELLRRYGALTRVETSVARHRIQALSVRDGPLHRLLGRASIDVETAGARDEEAGGSEGGRLAPIVAVAAVPALVAQVLPGVALDRVPWRPVHPRARRRVLREALVVALPFGVVAVAFLGWWALPLLAALLAWALLYARGFVGHLAWAVTDEAVYFRSGWWWRSLSVAPIDRLQVVSLHRSPFDRRAGMARLRADVAGASSGAHRIDIPYLPPEVALELRDRLTEGAARTRYRW
jgi:putative membrane protein